MRHCTDPDTCGINQRRTHRWRMSFMMEISFLICWPMFCCWIFSLSSTCVCGMVDGREDPIDQLLIYGLIRRQSYRSRTRLDRHGLARLRVDGKLHPLGMDMCMYRRGLLRRSSLVCVCFVCAHGRTDGRTYIHTRHPSPLPDPMPHPCVGCGYSLAKGALPQGLPQLILADPLAPHDCSCSSPRAAPSSPVQSGPFPAAACGGRLGSTGLQSGFEACVCVE